MTVFILEGIDPGAVRVLKESFDVVTCEDERVFRWRDEADAIIVRVMKVTDGDVSAARRLKVIGKHGVGVDNIDLEAARERGIRVVNTPGANVEAVAELTLGLALAAARHIPRADRLVRRGNLPVRDELLGTELREKSLGVVGLGRIGRRVAALFRTAFDMDVWGYDPNVRPEVWEELDVYKASSLSELLPEVDVLTIHVPLFPETRGLIGRNELMLMRPTAMLVNTSRGGIVNEGALAEALRSGQLAAAAGDVFEEEPPPPEHPLLGCDRFVATPHLGAVTAEAMERMGMTVAAEVKEELKGGRSRFRLG